MKTIFFLILGLSCANLCHGQMRGFTPQPAPVFQPPVYQQPAFQPQATPAPVYTAPRQVYQPSVYTAPTHGYTPPAQTTHQVYQPRPSVELTHDYSPKTTYSPPRETTVAPTHRHAQAGTDTAPATPSAERAHRHAAPSPDAGTTPAGASGDAAYTPAKKSHPAVASGGKPAATSETAYAHTGGKPATGETPSANPDRHRNGHPGKAPSSAIVTASANHAATNPPAPQASHSRPHTNAYPETAHAPTATTFTAGGAPSSGQLASDRSPGARVTVVNTVGGPAVDARINTFYANETAQYELASRVLDTWNNALEAEFAADPTPDGGLVMVAQEAPPPVVLEPAGLVVQPMPPLVVPVAAMTVAQDDPAPAHSLRRSSTAARTDAAGSASSPDPSTPDGEAPVSTPPVSSGARLLAASENDLTEPDRLEFDTLLSMAFQLQTLAGPEAMAMQTVFLDRSDVYLKTHPDERALWLLRARLALHANLAPVGTTAGANLRRLACFGDPKLHGLMVAMNIRQWLPDLPAAR